MLAAGAARRAPPVEGAALAFLPPGNAVAEAVTEIGEILDESGDVRVVTLVFRGEALTPGGLTQIDALVDAIATDARVADLLAPGDPIVSPPALVAAALGRPRPGPARPHGGVPASASLRASASRWASVSSASGCVGSPRSRSLASERRR